MGTLHIPNKEDTMKALTWKWIVTGLIGVALVLSACNTATSGPGQPAGSSGPTEAKVTQAFTVSGDVTVTIDTYNGDINVKTGGTDQVQVEVVKRGGGTTDAQTKADLDNIQLSLSQAAGQVKLIATHKGVVPANSEALFNVTVPPGSAIVASVDNGSINVDGISADTTATVGNGDVTISNVSKGDLSAKSTNGNVILSGRDVASLKASTSNGNASFSGSVAASKAANRIDVGNGSATVSLPGDAQFGLDALTSNGSVASDFSFQGDTSSTAIKGTLGASPTFNLVVRVKNGAITFKKG